MSEQAYVPKGNEENNEWPEQPAATFPRASGNIQAIVWQGPGWYAPVAEGAGWNTTQYYHIPGYDRQGYDEETGDRRIDDQARALGLGTPGWLDKLDAVEWDIVCGDAIANPADAELVHDDGIVTCATCKTAYAV